MSITQGASQVISQDLPPRIRSLESTPQNVLLLVGIFQWGPMSLATSVYDFDQALDLFGDYDANYHGLLQLRQFFLNGGRQAIVVRTSHLSSGAPASAAKSTKTLQTSATAPTQGAVLGSVVGPFALAHGDTFVGSVDGAGNQTLTISATAAARENGAAETYALVNAQTLTVKIDGGSVQTIAFLTAEFSDISNATAEEVAAVINAKIVGAQATVTSGGTKVTITSDKKGTDSHVEVTGGTANVALSFNTTAVDGTGNVADVSSVSATELGGLIDATWTNGGGVTSSSVGGALKITADTAGSSGSVQVISSSTGDDEVGLDNAVHAGSDGTAVDTLTLDGLYYGGTIGNALSVTVQAASNGESDRFDLLVYLNGVLKEAFRNVTMDSTDEAYVVDVVNTLSGKSKWITATDEGAVGTTTQRRPANASAQSLASGDDGLTSLADSDFVGTSQYKTGLYAFDEVKEGHYLCVPDRATQTVQNSAISYCESVKLNTVIFIPDPAAGMSVDSAITQADNLTASEARTALYWPRVKIPNPSKSVYGSSDQITIAPSCSIAGKHTQLSLKNEMGPFMQPGNQIYGRLENVVALESTVTNALSIREKAAPHKINCIVSGRTQAGDFAVWCDDVMAGKLDGNFVSFGEIAGMAVIRRDIMNYLETIRTQPNTQEARSLDELILSAYMAGWTARGAFASKKASEAFYVNTDPLGKTLNNPLEQNAQRYTVLVAAATARPRRFVTVQFTRDQRAVEAFIQKQLAS